MKKYYNEKRVSEIWTKISITRQTAQRVVDVAYKELGKTPTLDQLKLLYQDRDTDSIAFERFVGHVVTGIPGGQGNISKTQWAQLMKVGATLPGRPVVKYLTEEYFTIQDGKLLLVDGLRARLEREHVVTISPEKKELARWLTSYCDIINARPRQLGWVGSRKFGMPLFTKMTSTGLLTVDEATLYGAKLLKQ